MAEVRNLTELGWRARERAGIRPERGLRRALVGRIGGELQAIREGDAFRSLLADLLGVDEVRLSSHSEAPVMWRLGPVESRAGGGEDTAQGIEAGLRVLAPEEAADLAAKLTSGLSVALEVEGGTHTLLPDEVEVGVIPKAGWAAATERGLFVALAVD
jgi:hypothetical protein